MEDHDERLPQGREARQALAWYEQGATYNLRVYVSEGGEGETKETDLYPWRPVRSSRQG